MEVVDDGRRNTGQYDIVYPPSEGCQSNSDRVKKKPNQGGEWSEVRPAFKPRQLQGGAESGVILASLATFALSRQLNSLYSLNSYLNPSKSCGQSEVVFDTKHISISNKRCCKHQD